VRLVGIDPGVTGALALLDTLDPVASQVVDMPRDADGVDAALVYRVLQQWEPAEVYLEKAQAMPKGARASFIQGDTNGSLRTAVHIAHVPLIWVQPQQWQRQFSLYGGGFTDRERKDRSRARAQELFPRLADQLGLVKHHNRAEALLIAEYGRRTSITQAVVG
jgi:hypothetical protein